jgi:ubiquinone/menaquinone biosynthesis C-methylase UbiE
VKLTSVGPDSAHEGSRTSPGTFGRLLATAQQVGGPPASFLAYRRNQLDLALAGAGVRIQGIVVEIGGGVSGQAVLLSEHSSMVVCTDLPAIESSHGGEIALAAALAKSAPRVKFVAARAEALPFASGSVDLVFSSYVFEHIDDRHAAVGEIYRILRPGGHSIATVPNRMEPIQRAVRFYVLDAPKQLIKSALVWSGVARFLGISLRRPPGAPRSLREALRQVRSYMTYPPHGAYPDRMTEIMQSSPRIWDELFESQGLEVVRRFTIGFEDYLGLFNDRLTLWWQRRLMGAIRRYGHHPLARALGHSYCIVARKADASA